MSTDESTSAAAAAGSRWRRLKWLACVVIVGIVALETMYAVRVAIPRQRRQFDAAEAIRNGEGFARVEPTLLGVLLRDTTLVNVIEARLTGTSVPRAHLRELDQLRMLWLSSITTDAELAELPELHYLQGLWLNSPSVTDTGLAHIKGLEGLGLLDLNGTQVSDTGLANLPQLNQLRWLHLENTKISDAGLAYVQRFAQLEELRLQDTQLTDGAIVHLRGMKRLKYLYLDDTNVSAQGIKVLKRALPQCEISSTVTRTSSGESPE